MSEETNSTTIKSIRSMLGSEIPKLQLQNIADTISDQTGHRPDIINLIKSIKQPNVAEMIKSSDVPNKNKNAILTKVIELVTDRLAYQAVSGGHRRSSYKQKKSKKSRKNRKKSKRTSRR